MSTATNQPQILITTCIIVITVGIVGIVGSVIVVIVVVVTVGGPRDGEL